MFNKDEQEKLKSKPTSRDMTPRRVTPNALGGAPGKAKGNALKAQTFDKFNSGMKAELLKNQKEEADKIKREKDD